MFFLHSTFIWFMKIELYKKRLKSLFYILLEIILVLIMVVLIYLIIEILLN